MCQNYPHSFRIKCHKGYPPNKLARRWGDLGRLNSAWMETPTRMMVTSACLLLLLFKYRIIITCSPFDVKPICERSRVALIDRRAVKQVYWIFFGGSAAGTHLLIIPISFNRAIKRTNQQQWLLVFRLGIRFVKYNHLTIIAHRDQEG